MTLTELKANACREVRKWCDSLPEGGDYAGVELITDRWNNDGDGDYAVVVLVHDRMEDGRECFR